MRNDRAARLGRPARAIGLFPMPTVTVVLSVLVGASLAGCAANRPVVYESGPHAPQDIDDCMRLARESGADGSKGGDIARDTATGAAIGGAATGVYGAVRGYSDVGNRALAGAAAGAAAGLIRGGVRASEPSGTFKGYVNRCLRDRGYEVIGWD